jgi:hypothetical protein
MARPVTISVISVRALGLERAQSDWESGAPRIFARVGVDDRVGLGDPLDERVGPALVEQRLAHRLEPSG